MDQLSGSVSSGFAGDVPHWAEELAGHYFSRTQSTFILHGNVRDIVRYENSTDKTLAGASGGSATYLPFTEYLTKVLFAPRKFILQYDLSLGLRLVDPSMTDSFMRILRAIDAVSGSRWAAERPSDPHGILLFMQRFVRAVSVRSDLESKRVAMVIDWADMVFPRAEITYLSQADRAAEIALDRFASSSEVIEGDVTLVLLAEDLAGISSRIIDSAHTAAVRVPIPDEGDRRQFIEWYADYGADIGMKNAHGSAWRKEIDAISAASAGLTLTQIRHVLAEIDSGVLADSQRNLKEVERDKALSGDVEKTSSKPETSPVSSWWTVLMERKRTMIERECGGMLEFVGSRSTTLDLVAVHNLAVNELRSDAALFRSGMVDAVPSGYLICGPSGSGKSFMVRCFAGEAGVPCVELRNFREKWVGTTEANLEKLLGVLSALAPVVVIVDEADAALGDRGAGEGDSGLSGRVFSRLISFMGDSKNRGRVVWVLVTNRPDLLSIDLKRQGRAEKHIPLFPPQTKDDYEDLFSTFLKKHLHKTDFKKLGDVCDASALTLSGSDLESVLFRAYALSRSRGSGVISAEEMKNALEDFMSPEYPDEIEYQTLLGVAESTSRSLIPDKWRIKRDELAVRLAELRIRLPRG